MPHLQGGKLGGKSLQVTSDVQAGVTLPEARRQSITYADKCLWFWGSAEVKVTRLFVERRRRRRAEETGQCDSARADEQHALSTLAEAT